MLKPLFDGKGPMRVAALMSGTGSNLEKVLEKQGAYKVVCILSDHPKSRGKNIAKTWRIPFEENDIDAFYEKQGKAKKDLSIRPLFDRVTVTLLQKYKPDVIAYCGYMSIASSVLVRAFLGVNVHPADLSILNPDGTRRFVGAHAVRDCIEQGQKTIRSTTHLVEESVDNGRLLMRSQPVQVVLPEKFNVKDRQQLEKAAIENQDLLKKDGDWRILPRTLTGLAEKRFQKDDSGKLYWDSRAIPIGILDREAVK